ncbi:TIGR04104 family putative zinc finger protein [Salinicoccus sp. HZC-1]|uniref:TIGR04104 family putative zinc finger protein n=1 Tax=Salinicoccus sp. HZC-1 TaxID=3385497 RepID=UPI00398B08FE
MTKCTNCGQEWTTKDKIKKSFTFSQGMSCPYCGADQFFSAKYRKKSTFITFIMPLAFFVPIFFDTPWQLHILIAVLAIVISVMFQLRTIELTDKEEYPF